MKNQGRFPFLFSAFMARLWRSRMIYTGCCDTRILAFVRFLFWIIATYIHIYRNIVRPCDLNFFFSRHYCISGTGNMVRGGASRLLVCANWSQIDGEWPILRLVFRPDASWAQPWAQPPECHRLVWRGRACPISGGDGTHAL